MSKSALSERQWRAMPWETKNNVQIAAIAHTEGMPSCAVPTVWHKRRLYAPGTELTTGHPGKVFSFEGVDWTQHNDDIAKAKGCSPSCVAKARHELGGDKAERRPGSGRKATVNYLAYDESLSRQLNALRMNCAPAYVSQVARKIREGVLP